MRTNIKYSIYDLLFSILSAITSVIGFVVLLANKNWFAVFWGVLLCGALFWLLRSIQNIQWFDIKDGHITVYSPFGVVKSEKLSQIKKIVKTRAVIFGFKGMTIRREHIVLCLIKSIKMADIEDAYNRKKKKYVIIPYTAETERIIQTEYQKYCDKEPI